jgi:CDP-glycerol glycerophosphotransferase (TagB/SpsB family)
MSALAYAGQKLTRLIREVVGCPVGWCARYVPRDKFLWCFGAYNGLRYADHSRMLFEEVREKYPEINAIWSTKSRRVYEHLKSRHVPVVLQGTARGFWTTLRAGVCIYTHYAHDHSRLAACGAFKVQLWHGIPLKKFKEQTNVGRGVFGAARRRLKKVVRALQAQIFPWANPTWDLLVLQSSLDEKRTLLAFGNTVRRAMVLGSIRNEWLQAQNMQTKTKTDRKLRVLYAPTHRQKGKVSLFEKVPVPAPNEFKKLLSRHNVQLEIRLHPFQASEPLPPTFRIEGVHVNSDEAVSDIYHSLAVTDIVVTDYSSIYIDAAGVGIPVICLSPDREEYATDDQGLFGRLDEFPGPLVDTWQQVFDEINKVKHRCWSETSAQLAEAKEFYFGHKHSGAPIKPINCVVTKIQEFLHSNKRSLNKSRLATQVRNNAV